MAESDDVKAFNRLEACGCKAKIQACCGKRAAKCYKRQVKAIIKAHLFCDCGSQVASKTFHHRDCQITKPWPETTHGPVSNLDRPMFTWLPCRDDCPRCLERMAPIA